MPDRSVRVFLAQRAYQPHPVDGCTGPSPRSNADTAAYSPAAPAGFITGVVPYHWTQVVNVKRDPFETSIGEQYKTLMGVGGALAGPVTAYQYDWNLLPMGQALWLKELETYIPFPPLQNPASYNLDQVMQQVRDMKAAGHSE
jgi:hypothetical protein